jgi:putative membrane-bound dehydrogenase-like protein
MKATRSLKDLSAIAALLLQFFLFLPLAGSSAESHPPATAGSYELPPGLELTLFAKEPDIVDPVALCFDEEGRVLVVEMRDYPYGFGSERKPGGTVRLLEDTDGDGRADRSTVFAEGLSFPTSIAPWKGGVIVTAPPEIIFLKDTNGDGRADVREVLLKGFTLGVTDSNVNGLRWGLDNRLHGVNGGNGGNVISTRQPGPPVPLRNLDFSFDPATGDFTPTFHTSGGFGLVFDEWGRSFVTYNINHLQQRIIPVRYLSRFAGFPPIEATTSISDHDEMSRIYPVSEPETRVNHPEQSGHFSSAGGMGFVGVPGYPGDLARSIFVGDVVGNLVHRDVLTLDGPIFKASRSSSETNREFFASRDLAFRPVGMELGPDGALYLIDMQRDVIEHPDYIPQKVKEKLDLRAGQDRGRIYRITPKGGLARTKPELSRAKPADLVQYLGHSNQWWRVTAQRLLVERQDKTAVRSLKKLAESGHPLARLHGLWTLQGLQALDERTVVRALSDSIPGLRENALLLAEPRLPGSAQLRQRILSLAGDPSARVRFQAALTLGQIDHPDAFAALRRVFLKDYAHRWSRVAVLSSLRRNEDEFLRSLVTDAAFTKSDSEAKREALHELADLCGARADKAIKMSLLLAIFNAPVPPDNLRLAALEGLRSGVERSGAHFKGDAAVAAVLEKVARPDEPALFGSAWQLSKALGLPETQAQRTVLASAAERIRDTSQPVDRRIDDIQLLSLGTYSSVAEALSAMVESSQPAAVQLVTIKALSRFNEIAVATNLVAHWPSLAPSARPPVINLLLARVPFHEVLIDAIEQKRITLGELNLDLEQRRRLMRESSPDIMARAAKLMGDEEYSNRKTVVEEWLRKLPPSGDAVRGRVVFEKTCAQCHALAGIGQQVGPDLGALAHRSVEDLLSNILDPNMAINPAYVSFTAETDTGEIETGIMESESAETVVLRQALGKKVALPRRQIKRLQSSGVSLMPEGLEAGLSPQDLRDLIAFLQQRQ